MTTQEVAQHLVDYCRKGEFEQAQKELYADDCVSIEPNESAGFPKETKGLNEIIEKGNRFQSLVEAVHECSVSEPLVTANAIAFILIMDISMKGHGRTKMEEICAYQLKDGKVILEQFFY